MKVGLLRQKLWHSSDQVSVRDCVTMQLYTHCWCIENYVPVVVVLQLQSHQHAGAVQ
jgi:hypothetical protein